VAPILCTQRKLLEQSPLILTTVVDIGARANLSGICAASLRPPALFQLDLRRLHTLAAVAPRLRRKGRSYLEETPRFAVKRPCCIGQITNSTDDKTRGRIRREIVINGPPYTPHDAPDKLLLALKAGAKGLEIQWAICKRDACLGHGSSTRPLTAEHCACQQKGPVDTKVSSHKAERN
jgi:hypothetical protein